MNKEQMEKILNSNNMLANQMRQMEYVVLLGILEKDPTVANDEKEEIMLEVRRLLKGHGYGNRMELPCMPESVKEITFADQERT